MLYFVSGSLCGVRCLLINVCPFLFVVCCLALFVWWVLLVEWYVLFIVCCLLFAVCWSLVFVYLLVFVVCCLLFVVSLFVARCWWFAVP